MQTERSIASHYLDTTAFHEMLYTDGPKPKRALAPVHYAYRVTNLALAALYDCLRLKPINRCVYVLKNMGNQYGIHTKAFWIGTTLGCLSALGITAYKIVAICIYLIPKLQTLIPLRKYFLLCFFTYKVLQLPNNSMGLLGRNWREKLIYQCVTEVMKKDFLSFSQKHKLKWQENLKEIARRLENEEFECLEGSIGPEELNNQEEAKTTFHTVGTDILTTLFSDIHTMYIKKKWFSKDEISDLYSSIIPSTKTVALQFAWNHIISHSSSANTVIGKERKFYFFEKKISSEWNSESPCPTFSLLCDEACQIKITNIRKQIEKLELFQWNDQKICSKEEYQSYFSAFFLSDSTEGRASALSGNQIYQQLQKSPESVQNAFHILQNKISRHCSTFAEDYINKFLNLTIHWRGRNEKSIKKIFFQDPEPFFSALLRI
ncbi:MAG: hypothetical protein QRY74_02220 [Chlamydia sp.]